MASHWVFDLDGTLVDVEPRYRRVHADLVAAAGGRPDPAYWAKKRAKTPEPAIGVGCGLSADAAERYAEARLGLLERDDYLAHDRLLPGALEFVCRVGRARSTLVTRRRDRAALERQLARLGLADAFAAVVLPEASAYKAAVYADIGRAAAQRGERVVVVSDSPQDVADAKAHGFVAIAVLSGLRDERLFAPGAADLVAASISTLSYEEIEHVSATQN